MQMNDIWANLINIPYKIVGGNMRHKPMIVKYTRAYAVYVLVDATADMVELRPAGILPTPVGDVAFPSMSHGGKAYSFGDLAV